MPGNNVGRIQTETRSMHADTAVVAADTAVTTAK